MFRLMITRATEKVKIIKIIVRLVTVALLLVSTVFIYNILDFILVDDSSSFTRISFHDYYESDADILIAGTSHVYKGINPNIITEKTGKEVFNLGTSNQSLIGGFYIVKDAVKNQKIDTIYYELSPSRFFVNESEDDDQETKIYIISDYIHDAAIKSELIFSALSEEQYVNAFSRLRRNFNPSEGKAISSVLDIVNKKRNLDYINYVGGTVGEYEYLGRGHWANSNSLSVNGTVAINTEEDSGIRTIDYINQKEWKYYIKMLDYCKRNNVELKLFVAPYSRFFFNFVAEGLYDEWKNAVLNEAELYGFGLIDLNLVKEEYLPLGDDDFFEFEHMNRKGAEKTANFISNYILDDDVDYFYDSMEEKTDYGEKISAVQYNKFWVDNEEAMSEFEDGIEVMHVNLGAYSSIDIPVDARMWYSYTQDGRYFDSDEILGSKENDYITNFAIDSTERREELYHVILYRPGSEDILYEAYTTFP